MPSSRVTEDVQKGERVKRRCRCVALTRTRILRRRRDNDGRWWRGESWSMSGKAKAFDGGEAKSVS